MPPVSTELSELSPALLQPQVTVVAILGELLATLPKLHDEMLLFMPKGSLYSQLNGFSTELRAAKRCFQGIWKLQRSSSDPARLIPLSRALAAWESTPWTTWDRVTAAVRKWQRSVDELVNSWARLARAATKLQDTCREVATKVADMEATFTAWCRELQDEAACDGTAQENAVELGQALGEDEGTEVVAGHEARVRSESGVAVNEAISATMERRQLEAALGLLERLVAACDEATAFPQELRRLLRDIEAALKGKNKASRDVPKDLVAKVAVAERLWVANARLAKDHLLGTIDDINNICSCDSNSSSARGVTEKCQKAIEDIPNLLRGW